MDDFNPDMASLDGAHWMMWFHRMELLARLGIVHLIPELEHQVVELKALLDAGEGSFYEKDGTRLFQELGRLY